MALANDPDYLSGLEALNQANLEGRKRRRSSTPPTPASY